MAKLHELLAAEKTPTSAWNTLFEDTLKKFGNPSHFFDGHSKALKMIEGNAANEAVEAQAREEKPVVTTVYDTLDYALGIFARAEDLQFKKNMTNAKATGTVLWEGKPLLENLPVDQLLGLEARLGKMRALIAAVPTLDATKHWKKASTLGVHVWETEYPDETTKSEKIIEAVTMSPATDKHPAQVQAVTKEKIVGKYTTIKRTGAATAVQKSDALKLMDDLLIEVKQARMRANETVAVEVKLANVLTALILKPFKE